MPTQHYNSTISQCLQEKYNVRPVLYVRYFQQWSQSVNATLLLSHLLYWWGKGKKEGWIYKSIEEMYEETGLTKSQQTAAIKLWQEMGILKVTHAGMPRVRHFQIDIDKILSWLDIEDLFEEKWMG